MAKEYRGGTVSDELQAERAAKSLRLDEERKLKRSQDREDYLRAQMKADAGLLQAPSAVGARAATKNKAAQAISGKDIIADIGALTKAFSEDPNLEGSASDRAIAKVQEVYDARGQQPEPDRIYRGTETKVTPSDRGPTKPETYPSFFNTGAANRAGLSPEEFAKSRGIKNLSFLGGGALEKPEVKETETDVSSSITSAPGVITPIDEKAASETTMAHKGKGGLFQTQMEYLAAKPEEKKKIKEHFINKKKTTSGWPGADGEVEMTPEGQKARAISAEENINQRPGSQITNDPWNQVIGASGGYKNLKDFLGKMFDMARLGGAL